MRPLQNIDTSEKQIVEFIDKISEELGKSLPQPNPNLKMVVIIPAKDEEEHISATLNSLVLQINSDGSSFEKSKYEILVLCHNCSDNTKERTEIFFRTHAEIHGHVLCLNSDTANTVGAARRILMNIAYSRIDDAKGLIISTDADTIPDKMWLHHLEKYIDQEISLVCGLIMSNLVGLKEQALTYLKGKDDYLHLKCKLESKLLPLPHDPWPRHNYHWGPNFAIKKSVYGAIGGIRPMHFLEDVDLYNRLISEGYLARHCLDTKVFTSTRIDSRCQEGFGAELRVWTDWEGVEYNVEGLEKLLARYEIYGLARDLYKRKREVILSKIASLGHIQIEDLRKMYENSEREESLIVKLETHLNQSEKWNTQYPDKGVLEVCEELRSYFNLDTQPETSLSSNFHRFS